jgi:hypothetical protein
MNEKARVCAFEPGFDNKVSFMPDSGGYIGEYFLAQIGSGTS